jgi:hypothetical protein
MKLFSILAPLALASTVAAAPGWGDWHGGKPSCPTDNCLTQADADDIVSKFMSVLDHPDVSAANATAQALIADGFFEKSDSINMLAGHPVCQQLNNTLKTVMANPIVSQVGSESFPGKAQYIQGVLLAPSITGINTNMILYASCNKVVWYWTFTGIGTKQIPINGINIFEINEQKQIADMYVEFNSIA